MPDFVNPAYLKLPRIGHQGVPVTADESNSFKELDFFDFNKITQIYPRSFFPRRPILRSCSKLNFRMVKFNVVGPSSLFLNIHPSSVCNNKCRLAVRR
jgi:hypothetical protein